MAKFQKTVDIWTLSSEDRAKLQPGQWVTAGVAGPKGQWCGQKKVSTVDVVAWKQNRSTKRVGGWYGYFRALRDYSKAV